MHHINLQPNRTLPATRTYAEALLDTGATSHFFLTQAPIQNKRTDPHPISVCLPNGQTLRSTHKGDIPILHMLPPTARQCHLIPGMKNFSLISVGKLCDAGCQAIFNSTTVTITHNST